MRTMSIRRFFSMRVVPPPSRTIDVTMLALIIFCSAPLSQGFAQAFAFTAGNLDYTENFDGMGATGTSFVPGWTSTDSTLAVGNGSGNTGGVYNVGSTGGADRAFGSLGSGTQAPLFGASFLNSTGATIDSLLFTGIAEQWRTGSSSVTEILPFEFSLMATAIDDNLVAWTPLTGFDLVEKLTGDNNNTAVDGNDPNNRAAINANATVTWSTGKTLWIRWRETNDAGSDGLYAIDDFRLTVTTAAPALYWDTNGATPGVGGSGTWDSGTLNWTTDPAGAAATQPFNSSNAATFAGTAGTVQVAAAGVIANAGITFETGGYVIAGGPLTLGAGPIVARHTEGISTISSIIVGTNGLNKTGLGTLRLTGANTFSGIVTLSEGTLQISADPNLGANENDLQFSGGTLALLSNVALDVGRSLSGAGAIVLGAGGSLTVNGSFALTSLALPAGGTLVLAGAPNSIGSANFSEPVTLSGSAPVALTAGVTVAHTTGMTTWSAPLALPAGTPEFNVNDGTSPIDLLIDGVISGIGRMLKIGDGTVRITRDNANWSGTVRLGVAGTAPLNGGRIIIAHRNALGTGAGLQMQFNDGILEAETALTGANAIPLGLSLGPGLAAGVVFAGADMEFTGIVQLFRPAGTALQHSIVVNNNVIFSGSFSTSTSTGSSTGIVLSGPGTLTLASPSNAVTEPFSIDGGATLILAAGAGAELSSGLVEIKSGALKGEGRVHDLIIGDSFADDAQLFPGNPLGTLIAGNITFDIDATLQMQINSTLRIADQLRADGSVALGNGIARLIVSDLGAALLAAGSEFTLIDNVSVDLLTTGFFEGLPDGTQMQVGVNRFEIDYESGTNANDVILRAIPEPSSLLIVSSAAWCFVCRRWKAVRCSAGAA
jgi:autotransporter-associated beta strand protein